MSVPRQTKNRLVDAAYAGAAYGSLMFTYWLALDYYLRFRHGYVVYVGDEL